MSSFEFHNIPFGFFVTFRAYGTWLHGDDRGSVDRFNNRFGTPRIPPNQKWWEHNLRALGRSPVELDRNQRNIVEAGIRETCQFRKWDLWAINVRTNHVHVVVSANGNPRVVLSALKANATRKLRETGYWRRGGSPWAEGGSKKYLWTERELNDAVAYVQYEQGE